MLISALILSLVVGQYPTHRRLVQKNLPPRHDTVALVPATIVWDTNFTSSGDTCAATPYTPATGRTLTIARNSVAFDLLTQATVLACGTFTFRLSSNYGLMVPEALVANAITPSSVPTTAGGAWTATNTTLTLNDTTAPDGTLTATKAVFAGAAPTLYSSASGLYPALWIKRSSTSGVLNLVPRWGGNQTNPTGDWRIDLSALDAGWQRITRHHPSVNVVQEFALGSESIFDVGVCNFGSNTCTNSSTFGNPCFIDSTECDGFLFGSVNPGMKINSMDGGTVWFWHVQEGNNTQDAVDDSIVSSVDSLRVAEVVSLPGDAGIVLGTTGSGALTFVPAFAASGTAVSVVTGKNTLLSHSSQFLLEWTGTATKTFKFTANNATVSSATQAFPEVQPLRIKWRYAAGSKACLTVGVDTEVCSAADVTGWTPSGASLIYLGGTAANVDGPAGWIKDLRFCRENVANCAP